MSRRTGILLGTFWFLYMSALGVFFPYYGLYLRENAGLEGSEVGMVLAMLPLAGLVMQPLWGRAADRSGARARLLAGVVLATAGGHAVLGWVSGFEAILAGTALLAVFASAVIPLGVSVSLAALGPAGTETFGRVRVFGTIGFLVLVLVFPLLLDEIQAVRDLLPADEGDPSEPGLGFMFVVSAVLITASAVVVTALPREGELTLRSFRGEWRGLLRHPPFWRALSFAFLAYLALQGPMGIFPIFVRAHGGSLDSVSFMWIVMLLPEIPLVAFSGTVARKIGPRALPAIGVVAGGIRWTLCGVVDDLQVLYALQALHGFVVAGVLVGVPLYVEAVVPERLRSTGQTLLSMAGIGFGGFTSNVLAGWLLERFGANAPYLVGGASALTLALLLPWLLPPPERPKEGT